MRSLEFLFLSLCSECVLTGTSLFAFFFIKHLFGCCKTLSIFQSFEKIGSKSFCLFLIFLGNMFFGSLEAAYSTILLISLPSDISVFSNVTIVLECFSLYLFSLVLIILLESVLNSFHQVWKILSHYTFKCCFFLIITLFFSSAFQLSHILRLFPVPTSLMFCISPDFTETQNQ